MLLSEMEIFYYVVELKSFSQAAAKLQLSKSSVSKAINKLEKDLNVKLLMRSTRQLALTEAGKSFFQYCEKIVNEAEKSYNMVGSLQSHPTGELKISAPPAFGQYIIAQILPEFLQKYPEISVNIELENRIIDMIEEGYDLAFRAAVLPDSNLIAKKIAAIRNVLCASPSYIKNFGEPKAPADLHRHKCCLYNYGKTGEWTFIKNNNKQRIKIKGTILSNQLEFIKKMVVQHQGLGMLPYFMIEKELQENKLIKCLTNYQLPQADLYVLYPHKEFLPLKVKLFITTLSSFLKSHTKMSSDRSL